MNYTLLTTGLLGTVLLISCDRKSGSRTQQPAASPATSNASLFSPASNSGQPDVNNNTGLPAASATTVVLNPQHGEPGHRCDVAVGAPLTDTSINKATPAKTEVTPVKTASGLNPKHGEPGHRCDVAVGSPLSDTAKKTTPTNTVSTTKPPAYEVKPTANISTTPGLNPKHGQPGHRCDLAVGAPLTDTAKAKTVQTVTPNSVPGQNLITKPVLDTFSSVKTGLNPKHGQPGHRCDIAVGAPLNSKSKQ